MQAVEVNLLDGDGDDVLNPGESAELIVAIANEQGWTDANNVSAILETDTPGVTIQSAEFYYGNIINGFYFDNSEQPFVINVDSDIELGDVNFELIITAQGSDDYSYSNTLDFSVPVSLYQDGYPFETNFEIKSSPLPVDFDNDGVSELVFGDRNGLIHVVSPDGTEWSNDMFPFDTGGEIWGSIAYADLDLDGLGEIVVTSKSKHLFAINVNGVLFDYNADQFLMGSPAIGNLDEDEFLEIVVSGYTSSGDVFIVNHDGSASVVELNEKVLGGASLFDLDGDGIDEIVVGTESNDMLCIINNESNIDTLFIGDDKFKASPSVLELENETIIMIGSHDNNFYAFSTSGEIIFSIQTSDEINSSAAFLDTEQGVLTFFGSDDGKIYSVYSNGEAPQGWPVDIGEEVGTVSFSDLDGDGSAEIIVPAGNKIHVFNQDGSNYNELYFPVQTQFTLTSAPLIHDIDGDGDLELVAGSSADLVAIDIMSPGGINFGYWSMDRGNPKRTGHIEVSSDSCAGIQLGDLNCDQNIDLLDAIVSVNIVLDIINPTDTQFWAADIDGDQEVDVSDVVLIINFILD